MEPEIEEFGVETQEAAVEEFALEETTRPVTITQRSKERDKTFFSILTGIHHDVVGPVVDSGADQQLNQSALADVERNKESVLNAALEQQQQEIVDSQKLLTQVAEELQGIDTISRFVSPATVAMISSSDPIQRTYAVNKVKRVFMAQELIQRRVKEAAPEGFWEWVTNGDFVDFVLSSPLNAVAAKRNKEYADKFVELLYSDLGDEDFEKGIDGLLREMSDFGLFTDANRFYLADFLTVVGSGSNSNQAKLIEILGTLDTALGVVDVGLVGRAAGGKIIRGAKTTATYSGAVSRGAIGVAAGIATDTARLAGFVRRDPTLVKDILQRAVTLDDPAVSPTVLGNHTAHSAFTPTILRGEYLAPESRQAIRMFEDTSQAMIEAKSLLRQAGTALDEVGTQALVRDLVIQRRINHVNAGTARYLDVDFEVDQLDNIFIKDIFGTQRGDSFVGANGLRAAQRLADDIGGEVRSLDAPNRYVVIKTYNVPQEVKNLTAEELLIFRETDAQDLGRGVLVDYLGSPLSQTNPALNAILKQAEAAREGWATRTQKELTKIKRTVSRTEEKQVFSIFEKMRDDPTPIVVNGDVLEPHNSLTRSQFDDVFYQQFQTLPTDGQRALFLKYQEYLDVDLLLAADVQFKKEVSDGVLVLSNRTNTTEYRVVRVDRNDVPDNAGIWDDNAQTTVTKDTIAPDQPIYRNYDPLNDQFPNEMEFISGTTTSTRRLYHSDVLSRNSGGPRLYERNEIGYYIKQERSIVFGDGRAVNVNPRTIMTAKTEKEVRLAKQQMNAILSSLHLRIDPSNFASPAAYNQAVAGLLNDPVINRIIIDNTEWAARASVYDVGSLLRFSDDYGLDLRKAVDFTTDGERMIGVSGPTSGMTHGQSFRYNNRSNRSRKDKPLEGFGGKKLKVTPAREAIERKITEGIATNSERAYMTAAVNGFLKSSIANNVLENIDELRNLTLRQKLQNAKIRTSTDEGKRLALEQKKIIERLNRKSITQKGWDKLTINLSNYLYDKNLRSISGWLDRRATDPLTALRGFVFDAKLGLFNFDQLFVQASQTAVIIPLAEGTAGLTGGAMYGPLRWALINGNEQVVRNFGNKLSTVTGLSEDQFVEMSQMLRDSGRTQANVSFAEFGEDAAAASAGLRSVREVGRIPFKEGELVARIISYATAYTEYVRKFPTSVANSTNGRAWIMNRSDVLTQGMTGASRATAEQLPFMQFLSYVARINEAMFSGTFGYGRNVLTKEEKIKLAVSQTALYGMAGWTLPAVVMDRIEHNYGTPVNPDVYRFFRKGIIDGIVSTLTPVETSVSSRLATGDSIFMLTQDMFDKNMFEFFFGPSGELGIDGATTLLKLAKHMATGVVDGDFTLVQKDLEKLIRISSTGNKAFTGYRAFKHNEYLTKNGVLIDKNINYYEAFALMMGIPVERIENAWKYNTQSKIDKAFIRSDVKAMQEAFNMMNKALRDNDMDEYKSWARVAGTYYSSMTPSEQIEVDRQLRKQGTAITDQMYLRALQKDSGFAEGIK